MRPTPPGVFFTRRGITSACRGNASAAKSITSISKSNAFTKRKKKFLMSNFSISNFTKNVKFS